ncbi:hypothetical protein BDZ97DRAFT_187037 [Flammula alnicola]|nr:hypothetical protein BDZ97DRAFT_187037 [Flammula alnicola]
MAGVVVTQTILLLLTITKRKVAFGESVVVHLVVRGGAWVFVLIVCESSLSYQCIHSDLCLHLTVSLVGDNYTLLTLCLHKWQSPSGHHACVRSFTSHT